MFPGEMHFGNGSFPLVIFDKNLWFHQKSPSQTVTITGNEKRHWDFYRKQILLVIDWRNRLDPEQQDTCLCAGSDPLDSDEEFWMWGWNIWRGCCWFRHIHAHILFRADVCNPNTAVSTWSSFVMLMSLLSVQVMLTACSSECVEAGPVRWTAVWWCSTVMRELNQLVLLSAPHGVRVLQMFCFSWTAAWSDCGEASGMS